MKKIVVLIGVLFIGISATLWQVTELMEVNVLVSKITGKDKSKIPTIVNVGPMLNIKGAVTYGAASDEGAMKKLKAASNTFNKKKEVVIYCGCCKLEHCPNVEPAYKFLKEAGFNVKILNLPEDLATDWIGKDYPMETVKK